MVNVEADILAGPVLRRKLGGPGWCTASPTATSRRSSANWSTGRGQRLRCGLCGQGYEVPAGVSRGDTRHRVGSLRLSADQVDAAATTPACSRRFSTAPSPRSNGRGEQRHRPASAGGRASIPPCGSGRLAEVLKPQAAGGVLSHGGTVEVVSSVERDGAPIADDLRWGVYVTFAAAATSWPMFPRLRLVIDATAGMRRSTVRPT